MLSQRKNPLLEIIGKEKNFLLIIVICFSAAALFIGNYTIAMWLGFSFAAYSAIANDSIQTIGTFIGSNSHRKWWIMWLYIGTIFLGTVTVSFVLNDGDVSYSRLLSTDDSGNLLYPHPEKFSFLQIIAPLILLILTRMKMPVSTTFLLLSAFTVQVSGLSKVLTKSLGGYALAFVIAIVVWFALNSLIKKYFKKRKAHPAWSVAQWIISGSLWSVWIMQDAANIAVFLPRHLNLGEFLGFAGFIFLGLGLLFYLRGDKIQQIVNEKSKIADVRAATLVDLVYSLILVYKLTASTIPMSTTWVFLGLLGGREIAMSYMRNKKSNKHKKKAFRLALRDLRGALIGLVVSVILAMGVNRGIREDILSYFGL